MDLWMTGYELEWNERTQTTNNVYFFPSIWVFIPSNWNGEWWNSRNEWESNGNDELFALEHAMIDFGNENEIEWVVGKMFGLFDWCLLYRDLYRCEAILNIKLASTYKQKNYIFELLFSTQLGSGSYFFKSHCFMNMKFYWNYHLNI